MEPGVYAKTKSRSTMKGDWYEVKVAALLFLRSKNSDKFTRFQLATNVEGAGALDDIVHRWQSRSATWHTTLVQLKHKERSMLRLGSFTGPRGDFSLRRYLTSYAGIKKAKREGGCDDSSLLGGAICNFQFVIYTNARAEKTIVKRKTAVTSPDGKSMFEELLRSNAEDELIFGFDKELDEEVFSSVYEEDDVTVSEFFARLTVFSGEPTESQLDDVIKKELTIACGGAVTDAGAVYRVFEGLFKQWWRDSDVILNEDSELVRKAVDQLSAETELSAETDRCTLDLNFHAGLNTGFVDGAVLVHVVATQTSLKLSATKILRLLHAQKLSFTFTSLEYLLRHQTALIPDWRDGYKDCLVVVVVDNESKSHESLTGLSKYIRDVLDGNSNKKTIIVSRQNCQLAMYLKDNVNHKVLEDNFDVSDLDLSSQEKIFGKEVSFQGYSLPWKCLYDNDVSFWKSFSSDALMETLLSRQPMTIGSSLARVVQHFIPRRLKRCNVVDREFLTTVVTSTDHVVVVGGAKTQPLVDSEETIPPADDHASGVVLYTTEPLEKYEDMCRAHSNVHLLHLDGEVLRWDQSKGDVSIIKQYVDRSYETVFESETVMVKDEKVILVIAEPGMGKTTLTLTLAKTVKSENPADWVIQINLRDHSELFNRSPQLNAVDFLTQALGIDSKLEKTFLRASLLETGDVFVFLDSFDEICPRYELEGCALLTSIMATRVKKAVVTSRHSMQHVLENHLSTLAYNMVEFSEEDQRMFFRGFWARSTPLSSAHLEAFIAQLMDSVHVIDPARQLMQVPLQTMMLAEVFHDSVLDPVNNALPHKLDMLDLFEQFIDKKFDIFYRKGFINLSRSDSKLAFLENHKLAALILFVPESYLQTLKNIVVNAETFLRDVEGAKYNSGLVISVVNKKPVFLHQMFAEYFAGLWFAEHYRTERHFLGSFLFHNNNNVVRVMFDRVLAKGHPLHAAILDDDVATPCDVTARDAGGRTPLHLAAALGFEFTRVDSTYRANERFIGPRRRHLVELLIENGARVDVTDDVFQWTPLEYAAKTRSWDAMEYLLAQHADVTNIILPSETVHDATMLEVVFAYGFVNVLSLLLERGRRVNHSMYAKCLLHYAAQYGYLDVVELLLSRGADKRALDYNGNVALHIASRFGHLSVVRTLIRNRSREKLSYLLNPKNKIKWFDKYVNIANAEKDTPLHFAMTSDIVRLLVSHGANLWKRGKTKKTCLHTAAWYGRLSVVDAILSLVRDVTRYVNLVDAAGISAVCYASKNGHAEVTRRLIAHGADVRSRDNKGRTCLHYASSEHEARVIIQSLDRGEINVVDEAGHTALQLACIAGRAGLVRLLAAQGGDVWTRDHKGRTGLHYAHNGDLVRALVERLGDEEVLKYLNAVDNKGNTALIAAARGGHSDAVKTLIEHGASVWTRDVRGRTCLHAAAEIGCLPVAETVVAPLGSAIFDYVTARDASGLTARDVATRPSDMDRSAYYQDARVALALWLDEILERALENQQQTLPHS